jgi:Fe-S cluster assembly iron-binding protein IscA
LALDEPKDTDVKTELDGVTYLVDKALGERLGAISVDFIDRGWRSGFVIGSENPVAFGLSACGGSCEC